MRAHRYREAIARFEVRLAEDPQDLCSLLRMGLCHLLDRSEAVFVAIYHRATAIIGELGEVPARARKLWFQYQQLVQSVTATALVVGGIAATTAGDDDTTPGFGYGLDCGGERSGEAVVKLGKQSAEADSFGLDRAPGRGDRRLGIGNRHCCRFLP